PFYLIGHMVNGINQIDGFLDAGCNAIEADVTFRADGIAFKTYHGLPCDCYRICHYESDIFEYLEYTMNITTPGNDGFRSSYALLVLDLKTSGINTQSLSKAGRIFANVIHLHLFNKGESTSKLNVLLGVESTLHKEFIIGFQKELKKLGIGFNNQLGWQISENEKYEIIAEMWKEIETLTNIKSNIWFSDGISNCVRGYY
ncbi:hypothetical protein B4U80_03879, partial [Leptotrombidium deliense]